MKKLITIITCALIMISGLFVMNDNQILAANLSDTFIQGDFTYQITAVATASEGEVEIIDYDETSSITDLIIPNTVSYDNHTYNVVSIKISTFEGADKVSRVHIPENLKKYEFNADFMSYDNQEFHSNLKTITVDENNSIFKVIDGVMYDMTVGNEELSLYPLASNITHYRIPEFIPNSNGSFSGILMAIHFAFNLESVEMPFENNRGDFTDNGILYSWDDEDDHSKGRSVLAIPLMAKHPIFNSSLTDLDWAMGNSLYPYANQALDFTFEDDTYYQTIDGNIYKGEQLILYPGGRNQSVYKIPNNTKILGSGHYSIFSANQNLKSLILPSSLESVNRGGLLSKTLKSIKVEGSTSIAWDARAFQDINNQSAPVHVYYDNGNTTVKQQMQAVFSHLTDEYFHQLGAVPTASITEVKTSLENKKDVKITWKSNEPNVKYEVRRYDANGEYEVVGSTTDTSFVDKTTAYNTTHKYEVIPYSLPVTSSQDSEDPLSTYHTFGTASAKSEIKTPVQSFQGTYVYKDADGKEVSITKTVEAGQSVVSHAPTIPTVTGYTFDKWTSDLTNIEVVDKDFIATATYKKIGSAGDSSDSDISIDSDDKNKPDTSDKPSGNGTNQPSDKKEETVITGDQTSILVPVATLIIASIFLTIVLRKKKNQI